MENIWQADADPEGDYGYSFNHTVDCNENDTIKGIIL